MNEKPELLPCPFCGGDAHYQPAWGVKCRTCGGGAPCRGDELDQWNRRAALSDHPTAKQMVAEAVAAERSKMIIAVQRAFEHRRGLMSVAVASDKATAAIRGETK